MGSENHVRGDGCSIHLKDCYIFNYNSGAGGEFAMSTSGGLSLIEGCTFERKANPEGAVAKTATEETSFATATSFNARSDHVRGQPGGHWREFCLHL